MADKCFVGIDLAWGIRAKTGLAAVDESGALIASASARTDAEIDAWLDANAAGVEVAAIDAPIVVTNPAGARDCERLINASFARHQAGCHPSNAAMPHMSPPRAATLVTRRGWTTRLEPADAHPVCLEVYPHAAMVGLFGLRRTLKYKRGPLAARREALLEAVRLIGGIPVLALSGNARWTELRRVVSEATRPAHLDSVEDEIDAVLCAHLAWLWTYEPGSLRVYGDPASGAIVAPPPPLLSGATLSV